MSYRAGTSIHDSGGIRVSSNLFVILGILFSETPSVTNTTLNSFTIGGTLATEGDVYAVAVLQSDTAPTTPEQVIAGHNGDNVPARGIGSQETVTSFSFDITGNDISGSSPFNIYVVGRIPQGT